MKKLFFYFKVVSKIPFIILLQFNFAQAVEVAFEQDSGLPLVYINLVVKGGSVDDPEGQLGISNFMAEMLLRGSRSRTKEQIDLELDRLGARLEVESRAESLIFRGAVLSSQLTPYLKLVSEVITQPVFPAHEIRKLKSETISQILEELGKDSTLASRRANQFIFQGHPYGNPILGKVKNVEKFTQESIFAQFDRLIREKRMLVVGTGDCSAEIIQSWTNELGKLRSGGEEPVRVAMPQDAASRRLLFVDKPDRTQTQILGGHIGVRMTDSRFFPLYLANYAFGGGSFSARMMVEIRVKRGWSYGAYSYFRYGRQPRVWQFQLYPATKDTPDALSYSLKMVEDLRDKGFTQEEFQFAKQSLINSAGFMYNTPQKRVENLLLERTLDLPDSFMKSYASNLEKVQLEDVNAALREFLKPEKLAITVLGTAKDLKDKIAKASGVAANQIQVVPYTQE